MKIGFIGLGRMGFSMVKRLLLHNIDVVAYNRSPEKTKEISKKGAIASYSLRELVSKLPKKKIVWLMLPAGKTTDDMINQVLPLLNRGDILIDGANDFYQNAKRHDILCRNHGVHFFDCGVSGGIWGLKKGYAIMCGGEKTQFRTIEPLLKALSPKNGYGYFGPAGSGHFVKSVHNIIEYIYLQGLAEGSEILDKFEHPIDIKKALAVWQPSSIVTSWLLDLANIAVNRPDFKDIKPDIMSVTLEELQSTKNSVKAYAPAFDVATKIRKDKSNNFILGKRMIAAIRREFGGHEIKK